LQKLLNELRVRRFGPRLQNNGATPVEIGKSFGAAPERQPQENSRPSGKESSHKATDLLAVPTGAKRANLFENTERAPQITLLRTPDQVDQKEINGKAARYYIQSGELYINMLYPAIQAMKDVLESEYSDAPEIELMRSIALELAERSAILRIGRAVVYALAKQLNKEWDHAAVSQALAPESLSLAADDYLDALQSARRKMGKTFRMNRQIIEGSEVELEEV
jgi:hypothetical protein